MARLYSNEQFPRRVVIILRALGHDDLTVQDAGKANLKIPDTEVLTFATQNQRAVLTLNRFDFIKLHQKQPIHYGMIICKDDLNRERMAKEFMR